MPERMPPEAATSIHRTVADIQAPFTREAILRRAGNRVVDAGSGRHFVLKSALSVVPQAVFHDAVDLSDAIAAKWDDVRGMTF